MNKILIIQLIFLFILCILLYIFLYNKLVVKKKYIENFEEDNTIKINKNNNCENLIQYGNFENNNNPSFPLNSYPSDIKNNNNYSKIINKKNPTKYDYILKLDNTIKNENFVIKVDTKHNNIYRLTFWFSNTSNFFNINTKNILDIIQIKFINYKKEENNINYKWNIINEKEENNELWYNINILLPKLKTNGRIELILSNNNNFEKNTFNYYADFVLCQVLEKLNNFKKTLNLKCLLLIDKINNSESNIWNDVSKHNNNFKWNNYNHSKYDYYNTESYSLEGPPSNKLEDNLVNEFSFGILLEILPDNFNNNKLLNNNSNKYIEILNIPGNNNSAINIKMMYSNNKEYLITKIGDNKENFDEIFMKKKNMYFFTYKDNTLCCFLDDSKFPLFKYTNVNKLYFNNDLITINKDKSLKSNLYAFFYYSEYLEHKDRNYIYNFILNNKIEYDEIYSLTDIDSNNIKKDEPIDLNFLPDAFENNKSNFNTFQKKKINDCPTVYKKDNNFNVFIDKNSKYSTPNYNKDEIYNYGPNKEKAKKLYNYNFSKCPTPNILEKGNGKPNLDNCPFPIKHNNPCASYSCADAKWDKNNILNSEFNKDCGKDISNYCRNSTNIELDDNCKCWLPENKDNEECIEFRKNIEDPNDYDCNIKKFDIKSHPDFKHYIRKDNIPCWNCNLTD